MLKSDIIKNLKENNNCYVREIDFDIEEIEKECGFQLDVRTAKNCGVGFVLEKKGKR